MGARSLFVIYGCAVSLTSLLNNSPYRKWVERQCQSITPTTELKWETIEKQKGRLDFSSGDELARFAQKHGKKLRGHTLVWYRGLPSWLAPETLRPEQLKTLLKKHIETTLTHYRTQFPGIIREWDVVNEMLDPQGFAQPRMFWTRAFSSELEFLRSVFQWAHQADPDARLFYNEYGVESFNPKTRALIRLIKKLKEQNAPIHGVGIQAHLTLQSQPTELKEVLSELTRLGVDVEITELDVRLRENDSSNSNALANQARVYQSVASACAHTPQCTALITWGFTDAETWIPKEFPGFGSPLVLDEKYRPKPAFYGLFQGLARPRTRETRPSF